MPDTTRRRCPDGGSCHGYCSVTECTRILTSGPLTGVFPGDRWPENTRAAYGADNASHTGDARQVVREPLCGQCRQTLTHGENGDARCGTCRIVWDTYNDEDSPSRHLTKAEWADEYGAAQVAP